MKFTTCLSRIRQIPEDLYCMYGVFGVTQKETFGKSWKKTLGFDENDRCLLLPKSYRFMNHDNLVP